MAADTEDFQGSVVISGGTITVEPGTSALVIEPQSGSTFSITGPVTVDTSGGAVDVNTALTPVQDTVFAYAQSTALVSGSVQLVQADVTKYDYLQISANWYSILTSEDFQVIVYWYADSGYLHTIELDTIDCWAGEPLSVALPCHGPYVAVEIGAAATGTLYGACVEGRLGTPAVNWQTQILSQGQSVSIAGGATQNENIPAYWGPAHLHLSNLSAKSATYLLATFDYTGERLGTAWRLAGDTSQDLDVALALPPNCNQLQITNNDTAAHTWFWGLYASR